jgi:hypothetical protein
LILKRVSWGVLDFKNTNCTIGCGGCEASREEIDGDVVLGVGRVWGVWEECEECGKRGKGKRGDVREKGGD